MSNTDDHWKEWGEQDPYFAVLSEKKFRKENLGTSRDEFFESGAEYVAGTVAWRFATSDSLTMNRRLILGRELAGLPSPWLSTSKR